MGSGNDQWFDEDLVHKIGSKLKRNETLVEYSLSDPDTAGTRNLYIFVINRKNSWAYQTVLPQSFDAQIEIIENHLYDFSPPPHWKRIVWLNYANRFTICISN